MYKNSFCKIAVGRKFIQFFKSIIPISTISMALYANICPAISYAPFVRILSNFFFSPFLCHWI
jgi:hypothetical protein